MKILQQTNPNISFALIPWFVPNSEQTVLQIGAELYQRMIDNQQETIVLTAMEGDYCKGVIIAYTEKESVHIWQARKLKDFQYPRLMFAKVIEWAKSKGFDKVTIGSEDKRLRRMFKKKYGFIPVGGSYMERCI